MTSSASAPALFFLFLFLFLRFFFLPSSAYGAYLTTLGSGFFSSSDSSSLEEAYIIIAANPDALAGLRSAFASS